MLEYLILALAGLAVWHLIADGIIAADYALLTRVQASMSGSSLDRMRDARPEMDGRAYHIVRDSLLGLVEHPAAYTPSSMFTAMRALQKDKELLRQVEERAEAVERAGDADLTRIRERSRRLAVRTFRCNTAGWAIYLVPIGVAHALFQRTQRAIKSLLTMPDPQVAKLDLGSRPTALGKLWAK